MADFEPLDAAVVGAERYREPAVEPGRLDLGLGYLRDLVVVEREDELCRGRHADRLLPAGLVDRETGAAQIQRRHRLGASRVEDGVCQGHRHWPGQAVGWDIPIETPPRLVIHGQVDAVDRASAALGLKGSGCVDRRWRAVDPCGASQLKPGAPD